MKKRKENKVLATYKFYDKKGKRLAIFGYPLTAVGEYEDTENIDNKLPDSLMIVIISCSIKDKFSKETAKKLLVKWWKSRKNGQETDEVHPQVTNLYNIRDGNVKKAFMEFCKKNYQKPLHWTQRFSITSVKNGKKRHILKKEAVPNKMDMYNIH